MLYNIEEISVMSLGAALDLIIQIEEDACERYEELARQMKSHGSPEAALVFQGMAASEAAHRKSLWKRRVEQVGDSPTTASSTALDDIEAPAYHEVRAFMTPMEALQVVLAAETRSFNYYTLASENAQDPGVRALFSELRERSMGHQAVLREAIEALPQESRLGSGYVDEPVAQ